MNNVIMDNQAHQTLFHLHFVYLSFSYTAHNIVKYCNGSVYVTRKSFFFFLKKEKKNSYHLCLNVKRKKKQNFLDSKCSSNKLIKMEHRHLLSFFYT